MRVCNKGKVIILGDAYARTRISRKWVKRETERTTKLEVLGPKVVWFTNDKVLKDFGGICPEITKLAGAEL
ncbi:MAG: DUF559 domain-containing protein [Deinococcus sp.]|nr:DUF559 domain-containing protein [Deinococcus sp.]MCL5965449.1 DUF559 domain-containing protein [Deinococcus sp.]